MTPDETEKDKHIWFLAWKLAQRDTKQSWREFLTKLDKELGKDTRKLIASRAKQIWEKEHAKN